MNFKTFLSESTKQIWFHGRDVKSTEFDYKWIKHEGVMQEGPGFYFTKKQEEASIYAGSKGIILKCELNLRKIITKKTKISSTIIKKLIESAPDVDDTLQNWGEYRKEALDLAMSSFRDNDNAIDLVQSIWGDFYLKKPNGNVQYLKNMIKLGIDASEARINTENLIVFNPDSIKVIE